MNNKKQFQEIKCVIEDAIFEDNWDDEDNSDYHMGVRLLLRAIDLPNRPLFNSYLSEEQIREIAKLKNTLTSKDMIDFAEMLKQRETPIRTVIPTTEIDNDDITADMIMAHMENDNKKNDDNKPSVKIVEKETQEIKINPFLNRDRKGKK